MTKRSFFKSIMGAVAAVALAPEIAFRTRLPIGIEDHDLTLNELPAHTHINPAWETASHEVRWWFLERTPRLWMRG